MFQPPNPFAPNPGKGTHKIRILIAEHFQEILAKWTAMLSSEEDMELVGTASTGEEAVQMTISLIPDIVILALRMPALDGPQAALQIAKQSPKPGIILFGFGYRKEDRETAAQAGVSTLLEEPVSNQKMLASIRGLYFSQNLQPPLQSNPVLTLSALEARIYKDMIQNQEIIQKIKGIIFETFEKTLFRERIVLSRPEKARLVKSILQKIIQNLTDE